MSSSKTEAAMLENSDFPPKVLYENRYCNQDDFSVLVCGGKNKKRELVYKLSSCELKSKKCTNIPKALTKCKIKRWWSFYQPL